MSDDLHVRIDELEMRYAEQSRLVEELNEIVTDCNLRIGQLQKENRRFREILQRLQSAPEESPDE